VNAEKASVGDLTGRVVVITGASSGIGLAAAEALARRGDRVVLVGRDPSRLRSAVQRVREAGAGRTPAAYRADFTRLDDVHVLGEQIREAYPKIAVLANNAGGVVARRGLTADGYESTLQANHLGPFLLTLLLRDRLSGGRIINTSSDAHRSGRVDPAHLDDGRSSYRMLRVYGDSKQANVLFTVEASRRWPDILSTCFHPGVVRTRFGSGSMISIFFKTAPFLNTPEQGADTLVWLATTPAPELTSGGYYIKRRRRAPAPTATDPVLAARLWQASLAAVGA
jgi:NAD(P)-dependent dehydrogenase (short-subunit alcohol dehydrogenase family)